MLKEPLEDEDSIYAYLTGKKFNPSLSLFVQPTKNDPR